MLDVVVVDDEPVAVRRLMTLLRSCDGVRVVGSAANAQEALDVVTATSPHLVFLDVEMPGLSGMDLASRLHALDDPPEIVFVTAFARFAVEAFGIGVTDYLLKPVELERLREATVRAKATIANRTRLSELEHIVKRLRVENVSHESPGLWLDSQRGRIRVRYSDILWVAAERDYVRVHLKDRNFFIRGRLADYDSELAGHGFARVHRSSLVQTSQISAVENCGDRQYKVTLSNGATVKVSRQFADLARSLAFK